MKVGVLGAGAGGCALAYELATKGYNVAISDLPDYIQNVQAIKEQGGIFVQDQAGEQFASVKGTVDLHEVLNASELIFVVTPAFGTRPFAEACKPYGKKNRLFVICPGSGGGALEFKEQLADSLLDEDIVVAETHTLPYAVRIIKPGYIHIYHHVDKIILGVLPSSMNKKAFTIIEEIWPGKVTLAQNVLETTLIDGNPVIHPPVTLMNAALIERTKGNFLFYADGITDSVADVMKAIDEERLEIASAFGITLPSEPEMSNKEGYIADDCIDYRNGYRLSKAFGEIKAQPAINHRYLTEDVGYVMVFWASLAQLANVATPAIDAIITLASIALGKDLRAEGPRTAEILGLTKKLIDRI